VPTDYREFYRSLFAPLQAQYGPLDAETVSAIIGFSAGGPVSLSQIAAKQVFVTCELAAYPEQQLSSEGLRFELFSAEGRSLDWCRRVLTALGNLSLEAELGDRHTIEIDCDEDGPAATEVVELRLFSRTMVDGAEYGLYQVLAA